MSNTSDLNLALRITTHLQEAKKEVEELKGALKGTSDQATKTGTSLAELEDSQRAAAKAAHDAAEAQRAAAEAAADAGESLDESADATEDAGEQADEAAGSFDELLDRLLSGAWGDAADNADNLSDSIGDLQDRIAAVRANGLLAVLAVIGVAIAQIVQEQEKFNEALIVTGRYAGVTAGGLEVMSRRFGEAEGNISLAREVLTQLVASGRFSGQALADIGEAAVAMAALTGQSAQEVVNDFAGMSDSATAAALNMNEQYHFLDAATYERIAALEEQGRTEEAIEVASAKLKQVTQQRLQEVGDQLNWLTKLWNQAGDAASGAWEDFKGYLSVTAGLASVSEQISFIEQQTSRRRSIFGNTLEPLFSADNSQLIVLKAALAAQQTAAGIESTRIQREEEAIEASREQAKIWKQGAGDLEKQADAIERTRENYEKMWATEGGRKKLQDLGVSSADGSTFSGGQWDTDIKNLDKVDQAAEKYNQTLQRSLTLSKDRTNVARVQWEITHGELKDATKARQDEALAVARSQDAWDKQQKAIRDAGATAKKSASETERYLKSLENLADRANKPRVETYATRAAEIATHNLSPAQQVRADAANQRITTGENAKQNQQLTDELAKFDMASALDGKKAEIQKWYSDLLQTLQANGNTEGQSLLDTLLPIKQGQAELEELKSKISALQMNLTTGEQSIQAQVQSGLINEIEGRQRLVELHQQTAQQIESYFPKLQELANMPGAMGDNARAALAQLQLQAQQLQQTADALTTAFKDGLQSGIASSLQGLASGTMSLSDAVKNLAQTIINSLAQIAAQELASAAMSGLGFGGAAGGAGLFGSVTKFLGFAEGGQISGPGTGTSDSIPIMASNGEYMLKTSAVQHYGVGFLDALNNRQVPRFADGGIVNPIARPAAPSYTPEPANADDTTSAGTSSPLLQQTLLFDAGQAMQAGFDSVEGKRAFMTIIRANAPTIRQSLGIKE